MGVTPFLGVWIEISYLWEDKKDGRSLPSWECGLKLSLCELIVGGKKSLPSWECGLKLEEGAIGQLVDIVTPFLGVWIEIIGKAAVDALFASHSLLGSVD